MTSSQINTEELPTSTTDNNADSDGNIDVLPIYMKMIRVFIKEFSLMCLLCIAYAALSHSPAKVGRPPAAFPFFSNGTNVKDLYKGDVSTVFEDATEFDLAFFMFYAPWDAECQEVREEFERTALHMETFVDFYGVNCWQPGSECRHKYNKVFSWPVLLAYTSHGRIVQYDGPKNSPNMIKFLFDVMQPYVRINSLREVHALECQYDVVIVAVVDLHPGSMEFSSAYNVALKLLEKEYFNNYNVAFAMLGRNGISDYPYIQLSLWNETLYYMQPDDFKASEILKWLTKHYHQLTMWISPSGIKSQQLFNALKSPSLVLFTPRNLFLNVDNYLLLKEVALEYHHCDNVPAKSRLVKAHRSRLQLLFERRLDRCASMKKLHDPYHRSNEGDSLAQFVLNQQIGGDVPANNWLNATCKVNLSKQCFDKRKACNRKCNLCDYKTSMIKNDSDLKSSQQLSKIMQMIDCKLAHLALEFHAINFHSIEHGSDMNIDGLACKTNHTLTFLAIDSLEYHQFAERFGIDILNHPNKTALLLINDKDEMHHVYDGYINGKTLREFILNYTRNNLERALLSNLFQFEHTHYYPRKKTSCDESKRDINSNNSISVLELDANNFLPIVSQKNKIVIVFYHSKQCAFCNGIAYVFLLTARMLKDVNFIQLARIDGDLNTLPWEFTMETYPTILLFPPYKKSETRAFPPSLPITVNNLISFILTNLDAEMKLNAMWSICSQTYHEIDVRKCLQQLRNENLALIELTLKRWRQSDPRAKSKILYKLQHLKNLHFSLAIDGGNYEKINEQFARLVKFHKREGGNL